MVEILIVPARNGDGIERGMPVSAASTAELISTGTGLAARLAAPLHSTAQLLQLLVPPLAHLALLPDHPHLCAQFASSQDDDEPPLDSKRFLRRQVGLVQKVLVEKVWPDWEHAVEAEYGPAGRAVLERYFVPPSTSSTGDDHAEAAAEVAISAYGVLSSMLSAKAASHLQPRALELVLDLLAKLSSQFSIEQLYFATVGRPRSPSSSSLRKNSAPLDKHATEPEDDADAEADPIETARWDATLRDMLAIPMKAANAAGAVTPEGSARVSTALRNLPSALDASNYRSALARSYASLLWRIASSSFRSATPSSPPALSQPLSALLSDPFFVPTLAPLLIPRFLPPAAFPAPSEQLLHRRRHVDLWREVVDELSLRERERFLREWVRVLSADLLSGAEKDTSLATGPAARAMAFVLDSLFGPLEPSNTSTWKAAQTVLLDRNARINSPIVPRAVIAWVAQTETSKIALMQAVMAVWSAPEEIKLGSEGRRLYLTSLLLHLVVSLPSRHDVLVTLSRSPSILESVSTHLSLVSPLTRLLGMLVAEVISARTVDPHGSVKPLAFGEEIWAGEDGPRRTVRTLRAQLDEAEKGEDEKGWQELLRARYEAGAKTEGTATPGPRHTTEREPLKPTSVEEPAIPAPKRPLISIIGEDDDDDDDDLEPYDLPAPPSASIQEALASEDPALYHSAFPSQTAATSGAAGGASQTRKRGRLRPPVYIPELVAYLKGKDPQGAKEEADGEAERVEMGLKEGEGLIRRKTGWGGELRENAVDLAFALMGLQNQFELEDFDRLKQDMLVALVVACPTEVAPAVIEQYFTDSYSIAQRHSLLATLAFATRELAGLPIPSLSGETPQKPKQVEPLFPSKQLPPAMHNRLVSQQQQTSATDDRVQLLAADLTQMALSGARADAETTIPQAAREKVLSVNRTTRRSAGLSKIVSAPTTATLSTLAADIFILPLINRFWLYLRGQATSGRHATGSGSYLGGSAAPQLLEPILLSRFLATLTVLVHAARHSPAFLAVVVPETLSFVLMLRPAISNPNGTSPNDTEPARDEDLVVASALELALAALDGTVHLDGGRMLMSSSVANGSGGALVADIKDWAEEVFETEERKGNGDIAVGRPGRAAAGVLLRVEEIVGKWRLSVGW
ncbi:hypothetical protein JCM10908_006891 [Rhodotorula pacifica]|uniref:Tel2p n=1 Tax=Rhodotorula pacifica TaxID=1495444 RepID=UPI003181C21F